MTAIEQVRVEHPVDGLAHQVRWDRRARGWYVRCRPELVFTEALRTAPPGLHPCEACDIGDTEP